MYRWGSGLFSLHPGHLCYKEQGVLPLKGITAFTLFIKKEVDTEGHPHLYMFY